MDFSFVYLASRFFFRARDFFHHWYVDASRLFFAKFLSLLGDIDKTIALRETLRHFTEPLYKDYSIVGRILGVIFRSGRVVMGVIFYPILGIIFFLCYGAWLSIPALIFLYAAGIF